MKCHRVCQGQGKRGESLGSAPAPVICICISHYVWATVWPQKMRCRFKTCTKMRQCFRFCQKTLVSWWARTGYVYLQNQNGKAVSDGPSPLMSAVCQGNKQLYFAIPTLLNFAGNVSLLSHIVSAVESLLMTSNYPSPCLKAESVLQICF